MKFISKLLYSLVSFTIFAAYKVENAFATIKVTLTTYSAATKSKCSTYSSIGTIRANACGKTTSFTICDEGEYLVSCAGVMASTASAAREIGFYPEDFIRQDIKRHRKKARKQRDAKTIIPFLRFDKHGRLRFFGIKI